MKFLIFATDVTPLPGVPTSGTALRTWGISEGLKAKGHEVHVSVPKSALKGFCRSKSFVEKREHLQNAVAQMEQLAFDTERQHHLVSEIQPDVIICGHWPAMALRLKPSQSLIVDLAGPHLLERHYQGSGQHLNAMLGKLSVIATADYFLVSGPSQERYFQSFMVRSGKRELSARTATVVMPMDPKLPRRGKRLPDFPTCVFGGVFLPWQDPSWALRKLVTELESRDAGHLKLIGGKHPHYDVDEGQYRALFDELSSSARVSLLPMLPREKFSKELSTADVALDLMQWNLERELAVTIRTTSYLWSGVPVIYNDYADLSEHIRNYDAGWTLSPGDEQQLSSIFGEIFNNKDLVNRKGQNAQKLARDLFSWDRAVTSIEKLLERKTHDPTLDIVLDGPESADFPLTKPLSQRFLSRVDRLSAVECRMATHRLRPKGNITLRLFALGSPNFDYQPANRDAPKKLIVEKQLPAASIRNNDWVKLDFEPITSSVGQTFLFNLEAEASEFSPWVYKSSPYPLLDLKYGEETVEDSCLCLRTTCFAR